MTANKAIITPIGRVSYPAIFEPETFDGKTYFKIRLIFDKTADLSELKQAAADAAKEKWGAKLPTNLKSPFKDGDLTDKAELKGMIYVDFKTGTKTKPQVIDAAKQPVTQESGKLYSGCYGRVSCTAGTYDKQINKGVTFYLNNVQVIRDGEPLVSRASADDEFGAMETPASESLF